MKQIKSEYNLNWSILAKLANDLKNIISQCYQISRKLIRIFNNIGCQTLKC